MYDAVALFLKYKHVDGCSFFELSVGDTSCYYHILSQDAFVIIQIQQIFILGQ